MAGILDELLLKLDADTAAKVKAQMAADPTLGQRDATAQDWMKFIADPAQTTPPAVPAAAPNTPATPPVQVTPPAAVAAPPATPASSAGFDLDKMMAGFNTLLDSKLKTYSETMRKEFVPVADAAKFRTDVLTTSLKLNDDYITVREQHRDEFGKPLDRSAFEKHVAAGNYPNMQAAYDSFVMKPRTEAQIAKGIAEGVKQKTSGTNVPAQTKVTSMSPAMQVIAAQKAKAAASNATGSPTLDSAVAKLKAMQAQREDAGAA